MPGVEGKVKLNVSKLFQKAGKAGLFLLVDESCYWNVGVGASWAAWDRANADFWR